MFKGVGMNFKVIGSLVLALIITGALWYVSSLRGTIADQAQKIESLTKEKAAQVALAAQCENDKTITTRNLTKYEKDIADANKRLAALKRVRAELPKCTPIANPASPAAIDNGGATARVVSRSDGLRTDWLYDFAGRCEAVRLQDVACQSFVKDTWLSRERLKSFNQ